MPYSDICLMFLPYQIRTWAMGTDAQNPEGGRVLSGYPPLTSVGRDLKTFTLMGLVLECFPFGYNSLLTSFMSFTKCHPPTPTPSWEDPGLALLWFAAVFVTCRPITSFSSLPVPHTDHKLQNQGSKYIWFTPVFSAPGMCSEHSCHSVSAERMSTWMHLALSLCSHSTGLHRTSTGSLNSSNVSPGGLVIGVWVVLCISHI